MCCAIATGVASKPQNIWRRNKEATFFLGDYEILVVSLIVQEINALYVV